MAIERVGTYTHEIAAGKLVSWVVFASEQTVLDKHEPSGIGTKTAYTAEMTTIEGDVTVKDLLDMQIAGYKMEKRLTIQTADGKKYTINKSGNVIEEDTKQPGKQVQINIDTSTTTLALQEKVTLQVQGARQIQSYGAFTREIYQKPIGKVVRVQLG